MGFGDNGYVIVPLAAGNLEVSEAVGLYGLGIARLLSSYGLESTGRLAYANV